MAMKEKEERRIIDMFYTVTVDTGKETIRLKFTAKQLLSFIDKLREYAKPAEVDK